MSLSRFLLDKINRELRLNLLFLFNPKKYVPRKLINERDIYVFGINNSGNSWFNAILTQFIYLINNVKMKPTHFSMISGKGTNIKYDFPLPGFQFVWSHRFYTPTILRYILLVRDPREFVVSSCRSANITKPSDKEVTQLIKKWVYYYTSFTENKSLSTNMIIRYEDMLEKQVDVLKAFFDFVGYADYSIIEELIELTSLDSLKSIENVYKKHCLQKHSSPPKIAVGEKTSWKEILTEKQLQIITKRADKLMDIFGYPY